MAWLSALHDAVNTVLLLASEVFCPGRGFVENRVISLAVTVMLFGLGIRKLEGGVIASGKSAFHLGSICYEWCRRAGRLLTYFIQHILLIPIHVSDTSSEH